MKHILITGCSRGLGKQLVSVGEERGHCIYSHTRDGGEKSLLTGDLTDTNIVHQLDSFLLNNNLDVFINNAAMYSPKSIADYNNEEIINLIQANITTQLILLKRVYDYFVSKRAGVIININSIAALQPSSNEIVYSTTKSAMLFFCRSLAVDAYKKGVRVVNILPGAMQTDMVRSRPGFREFLCTDYVSRRVYDVIEDEDAYISEIVIRKNNKYGTDNSI